MKLQINGQTLEVPTDYVAKLSQDLWGIIEGLYEEKIPDAMKTGFAIPVRAMLVAEEVKIRATHGKEAARAMRPPPKEDVNLWLFKKFLPYVQEQLNAATIICETTGETVSAFNVSLSSNSESREQVGIDRNVGVWEDYGVKVS